MIGGLEPAGVAYEGFMVLKAEDIFFRVWEDSICRFRRTVWL